MIVWVSTCLYAVLCSQENNESMGEHRLGHCNVFTEK